MMTRTSPVQVRAWLLAIVMTTIGLAGPVVAEEDEAHPRDPWEGFNRAVFSFNDTLDFYLLKPVAKGYDKAMPDPLQDGVSNFFNNIGEIKTIFNDLLQLKFKQAGLDSTRFLVNSTVGIFGFIDIGSRIGLEQHDEDFGQTLGYWGVSSGPYLVLPFLGPNTLRDSTGLIPDYYISPYNDIDHDLTRYSIRAMEIIDLRAGLLEAESLVAGDRYSFFRNAYLQRRDFLVNDGQMADDFLEDDDLFEDFDDEADFEEDGDAL
ncbi:VacJ family lipoprotein [Ketobacter sp.]|uniref:MlaA family lipoprotein n=1 Tax=Ketobacter sp. TaxID=2083498 RepID=UPI000F19F99E|nr:VacJ family lipoprotein [Ketobacter sp.]RLT99324.1 MAG: VacJ family lipoprotein [Ketobacter sp.]